MDWDFLVLWQSGDTTWIPYVEARPLEAFDDYVKDHPELRIKPQNLRIADTAKTYIGLTSKRGLWWCDAPYTNSQKPDVLSKQLVVDVVYSQLVWLVSIYTRLGVVDLTGHCLGQP